MTLHVIISIVALAVVLLMMLGELMRSRHNEGVLRRRGAVEPTGDVYRTLAWAYPGMFVAMAIEGVISPPSPGLIMLAGAVVFSAAKLLKFWAIAALGIRWTYRVLVPPDAPLIASGPYVWLRHPNYVSVFGEIAGMALIVGSPVTGAISLIAFGVLVRRRIAVEDRALGK